MSTLAEMDRVVDKLQRLIEDKDLKRCSWCKNVFPASCLDSVSEQDSTKLCPGCLHCLRHGAPPYGNLP